MRHADVAVVVANPEVSSIRDADRIIGMLDATTEKAGRVNTSRSTFSSPATIRPGPTRRDLEGGGRSRNSFHSASRDHP